MMPQWRESIGRQQAQRPRRRERRRQRWRVDLTGDARLRVLAGEGAHQPLGTEQLQATPGALGQFVAAQRQHGQRDHQRVVGDVAHDVPAQAGQVRGRVQLLPCQHRGADGGMGRGAQQIDQFDHHRQRRHARHRSGQSLRLLLALHARHQAGLDAFGDAEAEAAAEREEVHHLERTDGRRHAGEQQARGV